MQAWAESSPEQQAVSEHEQDQHVQHLQQQVENLHRHMSVSEAVQQNLQEQLQQQQEQHQQAISDLQAQHDNSSKKLFRELKAAQVAKEQALASKRTLEHANRRVTCKLA